ncbi:MAG TPA: helix-turn-helix domain-containing protein [Anaerolineales bacterium]|nr:helix-turn-helix domain-containing protein [Anaerolineae bacterium]HIP87389.1 helix-turn-helix domain-containing protein [Anaerolineales bacterium]
MRSDLPVLKESPHWLTLGEAARLLGVHPTTLRRWSERGEIPYLRTPGGHRRFLREDLETFVRKRKRSADLPTPDHLAHGLIQQARREVVDGIAGEPWYVAFDATDRAARRESGRRLVGLAIQYTLRTTGREPILEEGRRIGWEYGQDAARRGLSLVDTVRAFLFFREVLIRAARPGLSTHGQYDEHDVHVHRSLRQFLDQVLFAALEAYERTMRDPLSDH